MITFHRRTFLAFLAVFAVLAGPIGAVERGKAVMDVERFSQAVAEFSQAVERGERDAAFKKFSSLLKLGPSREIIQRLSELPGTRQLFALKFPKDIDWSPIISPDGRRFVYLGWQRGAAQPHTVIYAVDMEQGKETALTHPDFDSVSPVWSPDSRRLLFESFRQDTNGDGRVTKQDRRSLWVVDVVTKKEQRVVSEEFENYTPQWMPDGEAIVWLSARVDVNGDGKTDRTDGLGLYRLSLSGKSKALPDTLVEPTENVSQPMIGSDGLRVVYLQKKDSHRVVSVVSLATGIRHALTALDADGELAAFRPDGRAIAAFVRHRDTNGDGQVDAFDRSAVWVIPLDEPAKAREVLSDQEEYGSVRFSPDGNNLAVTKVPHANGKKRLTTGTGKRGVALVSLGASGTGKGEPVTIVGNQFDNDVVAFYPDGRKLLFQSWRLDTNRDGNLDILDIPSLFLLDLASAPSVRMTTVIQPDGTCTRVVELVTDPLFIETVKRQQGIFQGTKWQMGFVEGGEYRVKIVGEFPSPANLSYSDTPVSWTTTSGWWKRTYRFEERLLPLAASGEAMPDSPLMQFAMEMARSMTKPLVLQVRVTLPGAVAKSNGEVNGNTAEWIIPFSELTAARQEAEMWMEMESTNWPMIALIVAGFIVIVGGGGFRWWLSYRSERARQNVLKQEYADAHQYLGLALAKKGLYEDALKEYQEALKHGPKIGTIHFHMAQALALKGDKAKAKDALKKAVTHDPSLKLMADVTEELKNLV